MKELSIYMLTYNSKIFKQAYILNILRHSLTEEKALGRYAKSQI